MNLLSVKNIGKTMGARPLFSDLTFGIDLGDRAAFIGANGSGKSTLMRILAGLLEPDSGEVSRNNGLRLAYLPQIPEFDPDSTVLEHILAGESVLVATVKHYEDCVSKLHKIREEDKETHDRLSAELEAASRQMDEIGGWTLEHRISAILQQLGISDLDMKMGILSGGMLKKVELGRALLSEANLIILDEPTNHLDLDTITWLQDFLAASPAALILITHDRYFLDSVCTRIFELEDKRLYSCAGNYSVYMEKRAERIEASDRRRARVASVLRQELVWLKRGPKARTGKDKNRVERVYNLMDATESQKASAMEFSVTNRRLGKKILEIKNITKSYGDLVLVSAFSYSFKRGIRVGVIGPNGSGKTTFLKMLLEKEMPDSGRIDTGINTRFGYFDQLSGAMDPDLTVMGYLREYADEIKRANGTCANIKELLEEFQFPEEQHHTRISNLSGGERRRLYLVQVLLPAPNFLIFDEPTNDLDIQTLSLLENFLDKFDGCVITVSHDRYFLDRTVDFLFIFDGKGKVSGFPGSYSEYLVYRKEEERKASALVRSRKTDNRVRLNDAPGRLNFHEQREFDTLLPGLDMLEKEKMELETFFHDPDASLLPEKRTRYTEVLAEIERITARWEELAERAQD